MAIVTWPPSSFGADTIIKLPNAVGTPVNAWQSTVTLTNSTAGAEASQWVIKLLKAGAQVTGYTFGPDVLTLGSLSGQITFNSDNWLARSATGCLEITTNADIVIETVTTGALATNATKGFLQITTCPGTPTGSLAALKAGHAAIVYDSTNFKLCANLGGTAWKSSGAFA